MSSELEATFLTAYDRMGRGVRRTVAVPNPPAGADWRLTVPGGRQWRVFSAAGQLVTSAVVANRFVGGIVTDGNATVYRATPVNSQPASATVRYTFVQTTAVVMMSGQSTDNLVPLAVGWYPAGYTFGSATVSIDAADQWSGVNVAIEEYFADDPLLSAERINAIEALESVAQSLRRA